MALKLKKNLQKNELEVIVDEILWECEQHRETIAVTRWHCIRFIVGKILSHGEEYLVGITYLAGSTEIQEDEYDTQPFFVEAKKTVTLSYVAKEE